MGARKLLYHVPLIWGNKEIAPKKLELISKGNTGNFSENSSKNCLDYFLACPVYAGYGMLACLVNTGLPNRHEASDEYRYGFNGMEKDDEVAGEGNSYTTEFRQYDSRIGRWLSLDPLMKYYPHQSGFCAFNNNPIYYSDPTGLEGEDPFEGAKHFETEWSKKNDLFPVVPQNDDVVVFHYIGDGGFSGRSEAYEYQEDVDRWIIKGYKTPILNNGEWSVYENSSYGIPAKHIKINGAPVGVAAAIVVGVAWTVIPDLDWW